MHPGRYFLAALVSVMSLATGQGSSAQSRDDSLHSLEFYRSIGGGGPTDLAVSPAGWVYVVGATSTPGYPTTADAIDRTCGTDGSCNRALPLPPGFSTQTDAFLSVFDARGILRYSTFLGGSSAEGSIHQSEDSVRLALRRDGGVWIAGMTTSRSFEHLPASPGCDGDAIWVGRFSAALDTIQDFQCLPGSLSDELSDIAVDADDDLWLTGYARSPDFPLRDPWQSARLGFSDAFVMELRAGSLAPRYSTLVGGSGADDANALAVAADGDVIVAGETNSPDFPRVRPFGGAPVTSPGDGFVFRLDASGRLLEFSTYLPGSRSDAARDVSIDVQQSIYVVGDTNSPDFPVTAGSFDTSCGSDGRCNASGVSALADAFVMKLSPLGELVASTLLGGGGIERGGLVATLGDGAVVVAGRTLSADFPQFEPLASRFTASAAGDVPFLTVFDEELGRLRRSTFVSAEEHRGFLTAMAVDQRFTYLAAGVGPLAVGEMFLRKTRTLPVWHW